MLILEEYPTNSARAGCCYACGSSIRDGKLIATITGERDKVIDFENDIEYEGRLCICSECVGYAATQLGFRLPDDEELGVKNRRLGRRCQVLEERVEHYRGIVNKLTTLEAEKNDAISDSSDLASASR
jgi:hypothetical protein